MNLFDELDFEDFTQSAVKQAMAKVNDADIVNADVKDEAQKIIDSLTFTIPTLQKTDITSSLSIENSDGKVFSDQIIDLHNNDFFATATYTVPFSGNAELFKVKPLDHDYDSYPVTIENSNLIFKIRTDSPTIDISEEWKANLIRQSFELVNSIEVTLEKLSVCFKEFENEMIGPVIQGLTLRQEEVLKATAAAKEINVFNSSNE